VLTTNIVVLKNVLKPATTIIIRATDYRHTTNCRLARHGRKVHFRGPTDMSIAEPVEYDVTQPNHRSSLNNSRLWLTVSNAAVQHQGDRGQTCPLSAACDRSLNTFVTAAST